MKKQPTKKDVRKITRRRGCDGIMLWYVDGRDHGFVVHGRTRLVKTRLKAIADELFEEMGRKLGNKGF